MRALMLRSFLLLVLCVIISQTSNRWPNHDISTLKLLQIVHRHGDRTPLGFLPNDPFKNQSYWREGIGQLTNKGKYRLYKTGQFIREEYQQYLGDNYSPREVYARSSITDRCVESISCLLSGAYPPKQNSLQWNKGTDAELGKVWQPIPIQTFMPKNEDKVLVYYKDCPILNRETIQIYNRTYLKDFVKNNRQLYENITKITGHNVVDILSASTVYGTLRLEIENNYYWSHIWTKEEEENIVKQLSESNLMRYRYNWDTPIIQRLRAGGLVKELNNNFNSVLNNKNQRKLYVYSTHDTMLAVLMHSLNIFNNIPPPFGATLIFELHEKKQGDYFLRAFYLNSTDINSGTPHPIQWRNCGKLVDCPIDEFYNSTKHLLYNNFKEKCNQRL